MDASEARRGSAALLLATAIAGGLGYVMQALAGVQLTAAEYVEFAVAWAAVFGIAGALAGVQQEVARSAAPGLAPRPRGWTVAIGAAAVPALVALVAAAVVAESSLVLVGIAVGAVGSASLLVVTGFAYAAHAWRLIATTMVLEAALRIVLLEAALLLDAPLPVVVLALVLPFGLTAAIVAGPVRRAARGIGLGTTPGRLVGNVARTIVATTATAVLVSGYPIFLEAAAVEEPASELGAFLYAFTLSRAPFVVVFLALQSFLVKLFQEQLDRVAGRLLAALGALVAVVLVVAAVVALIGPTLLGLVGEGFVLDGWTLFWIVASAAPMSVLAVTGPLVLAAGLRSAYASGWVIAAAIAAIGVLLVPGPLAVKALVAISVGPLAGATVHVAAFLRSRR